MNFPRIRMRSPVDLLPANAALLARLQGFEPWTYGLEGRCSILLSYRRIQEFQSHILTRNGPPVRYIIIVHQTDIKNRLWNWDISDGTFTFGFGYHDLCT